MSENNNAKSIAVIGAGIAGLASAYELQKAGFNVEVFEKNNYAGGRMASRAKDGMLFDIGANFLVDNYAGIKAYCKELDIMDQFQPMECGNHYVVKAGQLHIISSIPAKMLKEMTALSFVSRLRLIWLFFRDSKKAKGLNFYNLSETTEYDIENAYNHAVKLGGKEVANYVIDAFTSTYQFHRADEISLAGMLALLGLMAGNPEDFEMHHTLGEMSSLPDALASKLNLHLSTGVENVRHKENGKIAIKTNGEEKIFDAAILATTANITEKIYSNATNKQKQFLSTVKYAATIVVCFRIPENALGDMSVTMVPYVEGGKISEYTNEQMKDQIKDGRTLVNIGLHEGYANQIMNLSDAEIFAEVKKEFLKVCPLLKDAPNEVENYDLQRWPEAMPKFAHGYLTTVKNFLADGQGEQNVYFAGDYLNSPWTEGALGCGQRVAAKIVERLK
ncbi:MAG: FAD-dependent oxidoreductase [bacterium]|nr:FAD-dependent oxidoreductase [bacterium]